MKFIDQPIAAIKRVALVAHDNRKAGLIKWCRKHQKILQHHMLLGTGSTGAEIEKAIGMAVEKLLSGPMGVISSWGLRSARERWTSCCFSGIHLSLYRTIRMLRRYCGIFR